MNLADLIAELPVEAVHGDLSVPVDSVTADSRKVRPGTLFVAVPGTKVDGHRFVAEALKQGAVGAVVSSDEIEARRNGARILVSDTRTALARLALRLHGNPERRLSLVGITGTNGKSTTAHLTAQILEAALGIPVGLLGTLGGRVGPKPLPHSLTTPDAVTLAELLAAMVEAGASTAIMEVSSHAIALDRVLGLSYRCAIFTNLSANEHLDFHGTFEDYRATKLRLFSEYLDRDGTAIVNADDASATKFIAAAEGRRLFTFGVDTLHPSSPPSLSLHPSSPPSLSLHPSSPPSLSLHPSSPPSLSLHPSSPPSLSLHPSSPPSLSLHPSLPPSLHPSLVASDIQLSLRGSRFHLQTPDGARHLVELPVPGYVNIYNYLAAASAALALDVPLDAILAVTPRLKPVRGRLEPVIEHVLGESTSSTPFEVFVDFAHTPAALEQVLRFVREHARGRVIALFGCGGDRDRSKRPLMGSVAARYADETVLTSDNSRSEDPEAILDEIVPGLGTCRYHREADRGKAIRLALRLARPGDVVVLAGKGHETTQETSGQIVEFDDREVARRALAEMGIAS